MNAALVALVAIAAGALGCAGGARSAGSAAAAATATTAAPRPAPAAGSLPARDEAPPASDADRADGDRLAAAGPIAAPPRVAGAPDGPLVPIEVEGFEPALVAVPAGAPAPRPLVVATHGAGGAPEPHCAYWRRVVGARAFVVCPRGRPIAGPSSGVPNTGFYYPDHLALGREVAACVRAATARFAGEIDPSAAVYVGFSQGATMGALMLGHEPGRFARAALVEGAVEEWSAATARAFHAAGGARVLYGCGRASCTEGAASMARRLAREGVATRVVHDERTGHALAGPLADELARAFEWLVEDDPRFAR